MTAYTEMALQGKNDGWRYAIAYQLIIYTWFLSGAIPVVILRMIVTMDNDPATNLLASGFVGVDPLLYFIMTILPSIPAILAIIMAVTFIHHRQLKTLITANSKVDWKRLLVSVGIWIILSASSAIIDAMTHPGHYKLALQMENFLGLMLLAVVFVPIQSSSEEFFFRGYLNQHLGLKIKNPLVLSLISGILFVLPHLTNPEMSTSSHFVSLMIAMNYFLVGFFATLVTLRDNGLEIALGIHAGNNLFVTLFANSAVTILPTPSLFTVVESNVIYTLISLVIRMLVFYILMFKIWPKRFATSENAAIT